MMTLTDTLRRLAERFVPPAAAPGYDRLLIGFISAPPHSEKLTLSVGHDGVVIEQGLRDAVVVLRAPLAVFERLFDPQTTDRAALLAQVSMIPAYPWNGESLIDLLAAFQLDHEGIEKRPKRYDGPFPMGLRYPASENTFPLRRYEPTPVPAYDATVLPELIVDDHPEWVEMYHKAWQIGFKNLRQPEPESGFVANFIDTAFNDNTFMWDSCFMTMFGRYGRRLFNFLGTLDNFYARQHDDGFICREISTYSGRDFFEALDPRSTGPNIMAWTEWMDYQLSRDDNRLREIFPALVAYHRWWRDWRTWPDGSYFTSGWGSGMDNQSRVPHSDFFHQHYSWVDATMQQALNCQILLKIAAVIGRDEFDAELQTEYTRLFDYCNTRMWDEASGFYYDVAPDGRLSSVKSIGAYWGLLSDLISKVHAQRMIAHLDDPAQFKRPHRVPSQPADSADYQDDGGYWLGGVWAPTNYMVLRGLTSRGQDDLAYEIARNHVENVAQVFKNTGTLWENYAPENAAPGSPAKPNFVGWTGISAINIPIEYLIGLRPQVEDGSLLWDIRLVERHGVRRYPFGPTNLVDLICEKRGSASEPPRLSITTAEPLALAVRWAGETKRWELAPGTHSLTL